MKWKIVAALAAGAGAVVFVIASAPPQKPLGERVIAACDSEFGEQTEASERCAVAVMARAVERHGRRRVEARGRRRRRPMNPVSLAHTALVMWALVGFWPIRWRR